MSGSCSENKALQLEVDKIYKHSKSDALFKITQQWNAGIFEGCITSNPEQKYLFTSSGLPLGYPRYTGSVLVWHLQEIPPKPEYECQLWSEKGAVWPARWVRASAYLGDSSSALYMVREKGKFLTTRLYTAEEFREFKKTI